MFVRTETKMGNRQIEQAVILAGGLGTRMAPFTEHNPKPMYEINGKPFLEYLIGQIKSFGIKDILLLLGYLPQKIIEYFGDGKAFDVNITYSITPVEFETGARLRNAKDKLNDEFLLMYCDNYCPINFKKLQKDYLDNGADIQITAYANKDGYTKSNLLIDATNKVTCYDKKRTIQGLQGVDIGYAIVKKELLQLLPDGNCNFEQMVYPLVVKNQKMFASITEHRYYSIGSWERIELTKQFFLQKKTIFLDRDGTLNIRPPKACYVTKPEEFIWIDGAREAVAELKKAGYQIFLISNQPGIARGCLTEFGLHCIDEKMQNELREIGGKIDGIYYCPHNWDEGCDCRKPKPGLFYQAQKEHSLNLTLCIMIGDDERDMQAAKEAGCKGILVDDNYTLRRAVEDILRSEK